MAFPMMPQVQWDLVRKMGPDELNRAAMGEYQVQGVSPIFALARIKEETALAAAFQSQAQKQQQEEEAKMQGVPVEDIPFTVAEGILRERGITGVDSSAEREMSPDKMAALQGGIAGGQPMGMEGPPPMGMEGPPPMMAYGGGLIPRLAHGGLISDSRAYQRGGQIQDPLDADGFMDLFGYFPTDTELAEYNASVADTSPPVDQLPDSLLALDTDSLSTRMQPGTAPPQVAPADSVAPPQVAPAAPGIQTPPPQTIDWLNTGTPEAADDEARRLISEEGLRPGTSDFDDEMQAHRMRTQGFPLSPEFMYGKVSPVSPGDRDRFAVFEQVTAQANNDPKVRAYYESMNVDFTDLDSFLNTAFENRRSPNLKVPRYDSAAGMTYRDTYQVAPAIDSVTVPGGQADSADTQATMDAIGATFIPESPFGVMGGRVEEIGKVADDLRGRQSFYSEGEREADRGTLRRSREDVQDLIQLDRMWKEGQITELQFIEAKDAIRGQYEVGVIDRASELLGELDAEGRFAGSEIANLASDLAFGQSRAAIDDANLVRNQAARELEDIAHIGRLTSAQDIAASTSAGFVADVEEALSGRGERTAAQQASLQDVQDRRTILSDEQLEGHKALAADQEKAIRKQAGFAADAALFGGVGDQLRRPGRDQSFAGVISDVGGIRGGELEDLMGVQTNLLTETTKIQDELIAGEKKTLQDIYSVGLEYTVAGEEAIRDIDVNERALQASLEQMNIGIGSSRQGVLTGAEGVAAGQREIYENLSTRMGAATMAAANFRARVRDKSQTTSAQIYEMSTKLLDLKSLSLEERRTIQAAINSGQVDHMRELLAAYADYDRAENAIVAREAGRIDAADEQWLDTVTPMTVDLAGRVSALKAQQGSDAVNQRITRENQLGSLEAWEALEESHDHTITDISKRDYQRDGTGKVVRSPQAAATMKSNALANAKEQYSTILRQRWGFLVRQGNELAGQEDPNVVQTVTTRLLRAGMTPGQSPQAFIDEQKSMVQEALQQREVENAEALSGVLRESRSILERPSGIRSINIPEVGQGWGGRPLLEPERRLRQLSRSDSGRNPWSSGG